MEKSKPLVSVLVPTKNSEKYLELCLKSLKTQTYKNLEIIVIDNHSTDRTSEIAKRFTKNIFIKGPERSSQLNFGAQKAKGKYLYRVDSDFIVEINHIENMVNKCEAEGFDAIATFNRSDPSKSFWAKVRNMERETYKNEELILASRFVTKAVFKKIGGFSEDLIAGEDYDFQNKLKSAGIRIGRVETCDIHLGEPNSISQIAKESFYYGQSLVEYFKKHPRKALKQAIPIRPAYINNWKTFLRHPRLAIGLVYMKIVVYFFAFFGFLFRRIL